MNIAKAVCALYHGERPKSVNLDKHLVSMAYLEYKFGTGSCHDCAAHSVKRFLRQIILLAFESNRMTEADHNKVCDTLHYLMTNENPRYLFELLPLFKYDGDKDKLLQIADFWFGVKGNIWSSEYENIEYCFKFICNQLTYYGELQLINLIQAKIQLKMFGYSGHKDYSLTGMLECYRRLPLTARKLMKNGMELLAISDKAGEIGDNRLSSEIDHELFDNAARLGPPLLDALFELKNYPKELVYWRDCVLLSLSTCIKDGQYCDDDLEALFCLVNSWINVHIEENRQYNRIANLKEMNALIVEKISNSNLKERVKSSAPCELREESNYTVHNSQFNYEYVVSEYTKSGYSDSFTDLVKTAFSDRKGGNHNIFLELRKVMDETYLQDFCMKCVVPFVAQNCNYTLRNSGAFEVLQNYDPFFAENDWWQVYSSIVDLSDCRHEESFRYVAENLETLTIEYCYHASPDSMEDLFNEMVAANRTVITACGSIHFPGYALTVDPHIQSMTDFVNKQVGTDYRWNSV